MSLPYENATTGDKALGQIQTVLRAFGCSQFGTFTDDDNQSVAVQFKYRNRLVQVEASAKGYAAAWLKEHPYTSRTRSTRIQHERKALAIANVAIYSILRDWIKGQVSAIETGMITFEGAFLGQILLPNGKTILQQAEESKMLAAPADKENAK